MLDLHSQQSSYGERESIFRDTSKKHCNNKPFSIQSSVAESLETTVPMLVTADYELNMATQRLYEAPEQFLSHAA
jgi:hypothetical protein